MKKQSSVLLIALSFTAFISLGLPDGLLGVAWPGIRSDFRLPLDAIGLLLVFSTAGYITSSFFSAALVRRMGIGGLLSFSCGATASALFIYSVTPFWWIFVLFAAVGGFGAGAIDAGLNTYVEKNYSERMMQWLHASFGIGITMGPLIMTAAISLSARWNPGYYIVGGAQALLALVFFLSRHMWLGSEEKEDRSDEARSEAPLSETLGHFPALLSMLMFFIYTGVELGLGLWAYSLLTISRGIDGTVAGFITGSYWAMFTAGRILAGWYSRKLPVTSLLYLSFITASAGALLVALNIHDWVTVGGIALTGFAIAPVFPSLISDTGNRVGGRHVSNTIGMQIASAGFGAAVVPSLAGVLARIYGLDIIPFYLLGAILILTLLFKLSHRKRGRNR